VRNVSPVDAVLSPGKDRCRECREPKGQPHRGDCSLGARPEIRHIYQRRFLGSGPTWKALPSEMEAWNAQPWWRKLGGPVKHFQRLEAERKASGS
jgi:hypothetical protein